MTSIVLFAAAAAAFAPIDAVLSDFPRLPGETDDSPRFARAVAAAPDGVLAVPKGDYDIASTIMVTNRCSLSMHPAARLVARAKMDYVVRWDGNDDYVALSVFRPDGRLFDNPNLFIRGGDIDGNGLASCLFISNAHHFTLDGVTLHNGVKYGLNVSRETGGGIYELVANNVYCKCTMSGLAGNVGIRCGVADCHFTDCFVIDYTTGILIEGWANRFTRCHVWGGTVPPKGVGFKEWSEAYARCKRLQAANKWTEAEEAKMRALGVPEMLVGSVAFDIRAGNVFDGCYADTAEIGFRVQAPASLISCGFDNNVKMGLRKSVAIQHGRDDGDASGPLRVAFGNFYGRGGFETLYRDIGGKKTVEWISNTVGGGADMTEAAARLAKSRQ